MSKLLFRLRNVPEDEAEEVRQLLEEHDIETYETDAGNWGISLPAIWLESDEQFERAKSLLDDYQCARATRVRAEYEQLRSQGEHPSLLDRLREQPLPFVAYCAAIGVILYLSISSFFSF
tara:strand:+ start:1097 stop:1456 length:360 start_codon:yes stop_codon:yes gene_type:complete